MTDWLYHLDLTLFYLVNHGLAHPVLDVIMPFITELKNWLVPMAFVVLFMAIKGRVRERTLLILLAVTLTVSDQFSSAVIKPIVGRVRPSNALEDARLLIRRSKGKSFPSSHAVNMAAAATLFGWFYRRYGGIFALLALTVGFSRIYVGVHYPFDVLAGFLIGLGCALAIIGANDKWVQPRLPERWRLPEKEKAAQELPQPS